MAKDPKKPGSRAKLRVIKPHERPGNVADPSKYGVDMAKPATNQNFTFPTLPKKEPTMATEEDVPPVPNSGPQVSTEPQTSPVTNKVNTSGGDKSSHGPQTRVSSSWTTQRITQTIAASVGLIAGSGLIYSTYVESKKSDHGYVLTDTALSLYASGKDPEEIRKIMNMGQQVSQPPMFKSLDSIAIPKEIALPSSTGTVSSSDGTQSKDVGICMNVTVSKGQVCNVQDGSGFDLKHSGNARWTQSSCIGSKDFTAYDVSTPEKFREGSSQHFKESVNKCGKLTYNVTMGSLTFNP